MKTVFVSLTPKKRNSTSGYLMKFIKFFAKGENIVINYRGSADDKKILDELKNANSLVFVTPLYVDGLPSHVLELLSRIEQLVPKNINVYAVCNCGFYEGEQCELAINMIKIWCKHSGTNFCGGIGFGAGEMIRVLKYNIYVAFVLGLIGLAVLPFIHSAGISFLITAFGFLFFWFLFSFAMLKNTKKLAKNIYNAKSFDVCYCTVSFCPMWLFVFLASAYWVLRALFFHDVFPHKLFKCYNSK